MENIIHPVHRSGLLALRTCPRYWFLKYGATVQQLSEGEFGSPVEQPEWHEGGINRKGSSIHLSLGTAFHLGAEALVKTLVDGGKLEWPDISAAMSAAEASLDSVEYYPIEPQEVIDRQRSLARALVFVFATRAIPSILETARFTSTEKEMSAQFGDLLLQGRADAIGESDDGLPVVYSWKTVGAVGDREFMAAHYDDQGLSEGWLVGRGKNIYNHMVYIIKGYAKSNEDGTKTFINGLVYPYVNPKVPFSYKALSPVFKAGWNRTPVWTLPGGVDDWLQFLLANQPDALDKFWASPGRVTRLGPKMDDWLKAMIWEMEEAWDKAMWAQGLGDPGLTTLFPIWNQSCFRYRRPCEMLPICHDGVQPLSSGMYELRKPHHVVVEEEV